LQGHAIVITGGLGDIGLATAHALAANGARVALVDLPGAAPRNHEARRAALPVDAELFDADVTSRQAIDDVIARVSDRFGRLDVMIANAATVANAPFLSLEAEAWERTLNVNLTAAFHCAQAAARCMIRQEPRANGLRGKLLFTGSWVQDMPWPESTAYAVSKAGVQMLARAVGQELAPHGITANVVAPGIVLAGLSKAIHDASPADRKKAEDTIPLGKLQSVSSVSAAFVFMCSDDANYMTGSTLLIDGGASLVNRNV
jgi:NAD(P)-dependent dehydrogenase (short-subunit alcohol dehydrogenase family)